MARIPAVNINVVDTCATASVKGGVYPFATTEGVLLASDRPRAILPDCLATWLETLCNLGVVISGALKGHGVRLLGSDGNSPCFIERAGASAGGGIILWLAPDENNRNRIADCFGGMASFLQRGGEAKVVNMAKREIRTTLPRDATADECQVLIALVAPFARAGAGKRHPATMAAAATAPATVGDAMPKAEPEGSKAPRTKRKGAKPSATAESETAHIRAAG